MLLLLGFTTVLLLKAQSLQVQASRIHCQPVPSVCRNLTKNGGYARMRLPNALKSENVDDIVSGINEWNPLAGQCHPGLKLFLCAIYAPICLKGFPLEDQDEKEPLIPICKSFCFSVKRRCEPVMMKLFNYSWPVHEAFNCSRYKDNSMCVREEFFSVATAEPPTTRATTPGNPRKKDICDQRLHQDYVLLEMARSSDLVIRADVIDIREAKGDSSFILLKIKRHGRRKTRKGKDCPDRVLVPKNSCSSLANIIKFIRSPHPGYLIVLETRSGKKTKYIAKVILPWRPKKLYRKLIKKHPCRPN